MSVAHSNAGGDIAVRVLAQLKEAVKADRLDQDGSPTTAGRHDAGALVHGAQSAFGQLESACSAVIAHVVDAYARMEKAEQATAEARAAADVSTQRARLEADVEIRALREEVTQLRGELAAYRERIRVVCEQGSAAELDGLEPLPDNALVQQIAAHRAQLLAVAEELESARSQCSELNRRLEQERSNRARLIAAVQALQHQGPAVSALPVPVADRRSLSTASSAGASVSATVNSAKPSKKTTPVSEANDVHRSRDEGASSASFDAAGYARQLLDNVEAVHASDVEAGVAAPELVERLTCNLDYAADVFARRAAHYPAQAGVFEQQLTAVLDEKGASMFGRHLSIAAHAHQAKVAAL